MDEAGLLKLKRQIDEAKQQTSELRGHQSALMQQLKTDWKCNTVEEANKLMSKMNKEKTTFNTKIEEGMEELEERYNA